MAACPSGALGLLGLLPGPPPGADGLLRDHPYFRALAPGLDFGPRLLV